MFDKCIYAYYFVFVLVYLPHGAMDRSTIYTQTKKKRQIFIQLRCRNKNKTQMFIKRRTRNTWYFF